MSDIQEELEKERKKNKELEERIQFVVYKNNELLDRILKAVEYIDKNTEFNHDGNEYGYMEWVDIINVSTLEFVDDLKSILKGDDK